MFLSFFYIYLSVSLSRPVPEGGCWLAFLTYFTRTRTPFACVSRYARNATFILFFLNFFDFGIFVMSACEKTTTSSSQRIRLSHNPCPKWRNSALVFLVFLIWRASFFFPLFQFEVSWFVNYNNNSKPQIPTKSGINGWYQSDYR